MSPSDKIAIIGHNGWAAQAIVKSLAAQAFTTPLRVLARDASSITSLPDNVEVVRYSWDREESITSALHGVDILLSFIGHEGLTDQKRLVPYMRNANIKLFAPSDLALPYTPEERKTVTVPREKEQLEETLKNAGVPFVTILIGNFTSFALDSPYMGIDIVNNRILHTGKSRENPVWLCSRDYVAAGYASLFSQCSVSSLAGRTIGFNELHPTTSDIEVALHKKAGVPPRVAFDSVENAADLAKADRLDALVRKKMGDGTHNVGQDIWEVEGYRKRTLNDFISGDALEDPKYIRTDEKTRHFLDQYFL
ncbi:hypothetical protein D6D01_02078 [Aureobasidium pullulans]|uniref:NmrA-like domain-containing protein n=1 Tax=Aureobasidium pullulans TaxID=5580 RepID=A0A4V4JXM7_AURPU|nr:hypothetical protein D6D01_02078 [Aureobasidium pullulans]